MRAIWQDPNVPDRVETVTCMREERTGEVVYATSWRGFDPHTRKETFQLDLHWAGFGLVVRDIADFRHRPAEQVLADPINMSLDFAPCDFVQCMAAPTRPRFVEVYDLDLARSLIGGLEIADAMLHPGAHADPEDLVPWPLIRNKPFGTWRLGFALHEAMMHALPFSTGFDLGSAPRRALLGERATFDFRSGETGCAWLYETTMRLAPTLPSDGDRPGWRLLFE